MSSAISDLDDLVRELHRDHFGPLVGALVGYFQLRELAQAEDLVQDTFEAALLTWRSEGVPRDPVAWLYKVCKNKALNLVRSARERTRTDVPALELPGPAAHLDHFFLPHELQDRQLRLLFAACHPSFPPRARIILTLKSLAGLRIEEIARGLGMQVEAVRKSLFRTRKAIREQNLPLRVPYVLQSRERLASVHRVLYLVFNEGYRASRGPDVIRQELCLLALRQVRALLDQPKVANGDTQALLALMLFNVARFEARTDSEGIPIELEAQDRTVWDQELKAAGIRAFNAARQSEVWSSYHFEAGIAALHCTAPSFAATNWEAVHRLYAGLVRIAPSSFVRLNQAVATFWALGPEAAHSTLLDLQSELAPGDFFATRAKFFEWEGRPGDALNHYLDALTATDIPSRRQFLLPRTRCTNTNPPQVTHHQWRGRPTSSRSQPGSKRPATPCRRKHG